MKSYSLKALFVATALAAICLAILPSVLRSVGRQEIQSLVVSPLNSTDSGKDFGYAIAIGQHKPVLGMIVKRSSKSSYSYTNVPDWFEYSKTSNGNGRVLINGKEIAPEKGAVIFSVSLDGRTPVLKKVAYAKVKNLFDNECYLTSPLGLWDLLEKSAEYKQE